MSKLILFGIACLFAWWLFGTTKPVAIATPVAELDVWSRQCPTGVRWGEVTDQYGTKAIMFVCDAKGNQK